VKVGRRELVQLQASRIETECRKIKEKRGIMSTEQMKDFAKAYSIIRAYANLGDLVSKSLYADALVSIEVLCNEESDGFAKDEAARVLTSILDSGGISPVKKYDVVLRNIPQSAWRNKIAMIKEVREKTRLGLKESKDLIDNVPSVILEKVDHSDASIMKSILEQLGAEVEVMEHIKARAKVFKIVAGAPNADPTVNRLFRPSPPSVPHVPNTFVRERSFQSMFVVGESQDEAFNRLSRFFDEKTCRELLKHASDRVDEMNRFLRDSERLTVDISVFKYPICGRKYDLMFVGEPTMDIMLDSCPSTQKISLIKELRTVFGDRDMNPSATWPETCQLLGLKEAKDIVDSMPRRLELKVSSNLANEIKRKLDAATGAATIKVVPSIR
jgi:large subunit ribosomal protein L7/L12